MITPSQVIEWLEDFSTKLIDYPPDEIPEDLGQVMEQEADVVRVREVIGLIMSFHGERLLAEKAVKP